MTGAVLKQQGPRPQSGICSPNDVLENIHEVKLLWRRYIGFVSRFGEKNARIFERTTDRIFLHGLSKLTGGVVAWLSVWGEV